MIFNKIYEQIGRLIDKQIKQVGAKGMRVKVRGGHFPIQFQYEMLTNLLVNIPCWWIWR